MIKPTEHIIRAMINLENNISWQEIVKWIDDSLVTQSIQNNHSKGEEAIKGQGANIQLETLLKHINNARQYMANGGK
jgi:hypothetical protein